jgi:predicted lipoprotein with Yx(FWY)xxD motif
MSLDRILAFLATAVLAVAACSTGAAAPNAVGGGTSTDAGVVVGSASSPSFGTVLTGPNGMTLYTHAGDTATSRMVSRRQVPGSPVSSGA